MLPESKSLNVEALSERCTCMIKVRIALDQTGVSLVLLGGEPVAALTGMIQLPSTKKNKGSDCPTFAPIDEYVLNVSWQNILGNWKRFCLTKKFKIVVTIETSCCRY